MQKTSIQIIPLLPEDYPDFVSHLDRHIQESGNQDIHFMPFIPGDVDRPTGVSFEKLLLDIDQKGWHRCWVAVDTLSKRFVGHVDLKAGNLKTSLHRCELGLGVERAYRRCGLGSKLMDIAIAFARQQPQLHWIDLGTFACNIPAQELYLQKGFTQVGIVKDRFRINETSIDNVMMNLNVKE